MAHSYVEFRGRHVLMNDIEIVTVVHVILDSVHQPAPSLRFTSKVRELLASWTGMLDVSAAGCLNLNLDQSVVTEEDRECLSTILELAKSRIRGFGPVVPGAYLNRIVEAPQLFDFSDRSTESVLIAVDRLINLLAADKSPERERPVLSTVST